MYLGIDIGTSGVKAVILNAEGVVVGEASAPLDISRPHLLWSEQNPSDWWIACRTAVGALDPKLRGGVTAIGLAGQMHGATLLGADMQVVRPAILWNDGRSAAQCAAQLYGAKRYNEKDNTSVPYLYGATTDGLKWRFLKLENDTLKVDTNYYSLDNLPQLLGILQWLLDDCKMQAA